MTTKKSATNITTIFNNHFNDFINDICEVFPDNVRILAAKNALATIRHANPKMIIKIWINYVATPYKSQIERGDISFFLNNDYTTDFGDYVQSDNIMEYINMLRDPIRNMGQENQTKAMKYIQNLSKIAELF
jgi:hypothetical protein